MDVGQIKWAGHYNSRTGEKNRYGFITRMADSEEFFFHREKIREGSALLSRFDDSDGQFVVFDTVPDPRKKNQFRAVNVCFLEEVEAEKLVSGLSEKTHASPAVRRLLLAKCPGTVLGNDPCAYCPLLDDVGVRAAPGGVELEDDQREGKRLDHLIPETSQFPHGNTSFQSRECY